MDGIPSANKGDGDSLDDDGNDSGSSKHAGAFWHPTICADKIGAHGEQKIIFFNLKIDTGKL